MLKAHPKLELQASYLVLGSELFFEAAESSGIIVYPHQRREIALLASPSTYNMQTTAHLVASSR